MKLPPLTPFMKPCDVLHLQINDLHEYNPPYPQSTFTHNLGMTITTHHINGSRKWYTSCTLLCDCSQASHFCLNDSCWQCDQIGRIFATLAHSKNHCPHFNCLFSIWHNFQIILEKFKCYSRQISMVI